VNPLKRWQPFRRQSIRSGLVINRAAKRPEIRSHLQIHGIRRSRAVQASANNRMAQRSQMTTNLMLAPGLDANVQQRSLAGCGCRSAQRDTVQ
jgi:hypothetical protein